MLRLGNALLLIYLYINIIAAPVIIKGIPISKVAFLLALTVYAVYAAIAGVRVSSKIPQYVFISFMMVIILAVIGIIKGNEMGNIMLFITPMTFLLIIPMLVLFFRRNGWEYYLRHIQYAVFVQAVGIIVLYVLAECFEMRGVLMGVFENIKLCRISGADEMRIVVQTCVFLPAGMILSYMRMAKKDGIFSYISMAAIVVAIYFTKTIGVWAAGAISMLMCFVLMGRMDVLKVAKVVIAVVVLMIASQYVLKALDYDYDVISDTKQFSIAAKQQQISMAMDMFEDKPVFGYGMGYKYTGMDWRQGEDVYLEVFYAMILSSVGLIGAVFYAYIFLYYPVLYILSKRKPDMMTAMFIASVSIYMASMSNPYIWAGGTGLFFSSILAAMMESRPKDVEAPCYEILSQQA